MKSLLLGLLCLIVFPFILRKRNPLDDKFL